MSDEKRPPAPRDPSEVARFLREQPPPIQRRPSEQPQPGLIARQLLGHVIRSPR